MRQKTQTEGFWASAWSYVSTALPLRYVFGVVIVTTVCLLSLRYLPQTRRELRALHEIATDQTRAMQLVARLQFEAQESRVVMLRLWASSPGSAGFATDVAAMKTIDTAVGETELELAETGALPADNERAIHAAWLRWVLVRDVLVHELASANKASLSADLHEVDARIVNGALQPLGARLVEAQNALVIETASRADMVAREISATMREMSGYLGLRLLVLALLFWLDVRRIKLESRLKRITEDLRTTEDQFHLAFDTVAMGMGVVTMEGEIVSTNRVAAESLSYLPHELKGMQVNALVAPQYRDQHRHRFKEFLESGTRTYLSEQCFVSKHGAEVWLRMNVSLLEPKHQGKNTSKDCFFTCEDVTREREANARLHYLANYDSLTGLLNRRLYIERLGDVLSQVDHADDSPAVIYLAVDSFDFFKSSYGGEIADELLAELGQALASVRERNEVLARVDDAAFAVIVQDGRDLEIVMRRAEAMRAAVRAAGMRGRHHVPLAASVGVASHEPLVIKSQFTDWEARSEKLLQDAQEAMTEARELGGDRIVLADIQLRDRAARRHEIEAELLNGLDRDEFHVVFQPQFRLGTGDLVRFEALCRWTSAKMGAIPPDQFIPIAEQSGLIVPLGSRVLMDALRQAKQWIDAGHEIGIAVNISPMQFMRPDFVATIQQALAEMAFPAPLLELEITEGIFIRDIHQAATRIREVQALGVGVALDDFGIGYSSLSYLQRMPIDAVKLDRSFLHDLATSGTAVSMVRTLLSLAAALGLRVVVEGVETQRQLEILRGLGCQEAQGFLLGRPESASQAFKRVVGEAARV